MRLADFIDANMPAILAEWESFAATQSPAADHMDTTALRNYAAQLLQGISKDLRTPQTRAEQSAKARGNVRPLLGGAITPAQIHAKGRAARGFDVRQLVAEYRALRAGVLRLWADAGEYGPEAMIDAGRFNEAVDQAIAESLDYFMTEIDRWEALLLGTLGHDLRGPLNAISVTAHIVNEMSAGRAICQHTEKLIHSGERMKQLLDNLLDYSRISLDVGLKINPEPVDLVPACREEIDILCTALRTSSIEFTSAGDLHGVWDASRIRQAVSNLITNAAKYGDTKSRIHVQLIGDDTQVVLSVENTGPTIPQELIGSIFEPLRRHAFADSQNDRTHMGLGLFIVKQVARAHNGDVTVESADGKTCFTITLPKNKKPSAKIP